MESAIQAARIENRNVFCVQGKWLLALYLVVPILLSITIIDYWLFDATLQVNYLPDNPAHWAYWSLVFNLPHIVASWVTFADKEYLRHYRRQFTFNLPIVFLMVLLLHALIGGMIAFVIFGFYTMYHVLSQQFGLSMLLMGVRPSKSYELWRWLSAVGAMFLYAIIFASEAMRHSMVFGFEFSDGCLMLSAIFFVVSVVFAVRISRRSNYRIGVFYLWANVGMLFSCLIAAKLGYFVVVVMVPRIVHDLTAFIVYSTHDQNRNKDQPVNYIYRALSITRLPYYVLCPLVAIGIAYPLTTSSSQVASVVILTLTYFHYYFEAFIWKGQMPHRQYVSFAR